VRAPGDVDLARVDEYAEIRTLRVFRLARERANERQFSRIFQMQDTIHNFVSARFSPSEDSASWPSGHDRPPEDARHRRAWERWLPPQRHLGIFLLQGAIISPRRGAIGCVIGHYLLAALSQSQDPSEGW